MTRLNEHKAPLLAEGSALVAGVKKAGFEGQFFHLLGHTPEQLEDIYIVMLDGKNVVRLEVDRASGAISDISSENIRSYRRRVRGVQAKELLGALDEAQSLRGAQP